LKNVQISDATLLIYKGETTGGSTLTEKFCRIEKKPLFKMNILDDIKTMRLNYKHWLAENTISILNIAGSRESEGCVYKDMKALLRHILPQ